MAKKPLPLHLHSIKHLRYSLEILARWQCSETSWMAFRVFVNAE